MSRKLSGKACPHGQICPPVYTVDLLYKLVLYNHTHVISTKRLGPMALLFVRASFPVSTLVIL